MVVIVSVVVVAVVVAVAVVIVVIYVYYIRICDQQYFLLQINIPIMNVSYHNNHLVSE
jgi:hypothetical protein